MRLEPIGYGVRGWKLMNGERETALIYCANLEVVELLKNIITAGLTERTNAAPATAAAAAPQALPAPAPEAAKQA